MAIAFPASPTVNEIYTYEGRSWQWNASGWAQVAAQNLLGGGFSFTHDVTSEEIVEVPYILEYD